MGPARALDFVRSHGIVLVSARGPAVNLIEALAGEAVRGSWWSHHRARHFYAVLSRVTASPDVVVCRLVEGKRTLLHRRTWAALLRLAHLLPLERLAALTEVHTPSGTHRVTAVPFPDWVPREAHEEATRLTESAAAQIVGLELLQRLERERAPRRAPATSPRGRRGRR